MVIQNIVVSYSDEDKKFLAEAGYKIGTAAGEYTEDELSKIAHLGTRLFVFTGDDATETPDFPLPITRRWKMVDTLCAIQYDQEDGRCRNG